MNRITKNCAHILVALLSVALSLTLVACASSKADAPQRQQFSNPPTQEEIDEFHRTHPVTGGTLIASYGKWPDINTLEGISTFDAAFVVEIIGEQELRLVVFSNGNSYLYPHYRARIIEVIFNNHNDTDYREYAADEEIYVFHHDNVAFPMRTGEIYLLLNRNYPDTAIRINTWNGLRSIECNPYYVYYLTDSSYVIPVNERREFNNMGRSSNEFIDMIRSLGSRLGWSVEDISLPIKIEIQ